jgi:tetratricopeptide (TPR) repeat protein
MPFGVYHPSSPSELNVALPRADSVLALEENNLERALISCPLELKAQTELILAMFNLSERGVSEELMVERAVALLANVHATSVVTGNRGEVGDKVDEAHQLAHSVKTPCPAFVAQTTRLKARAAAAAGDYQTARELFEQIEAERDPQEGEGSHPSRYRDEIEIAFLRLCLTPSERAALTVFPEKEYRVQCNAIARALDAASKCEPEARVSVAKDLLWLAFHYARYPLLAPKPIPGAPPHVPLSAVCQQARQLLGRAGAAEGESEGLRLMGAIALERGDYRRSAEIFVSGIPRFTSNDGLLEIEFLHSAGEALSYAGEPDYTAGLTLLSRAVDRAREQIGVEAVFYELKFAEVLLHGWRIDECKGILAAIDQEYIRDSDQALKLAMYLSLKARVADLEGDSEKAIGLLRSARVAMQPRDSEADGNGRSTAVGRQVQGRLDRLRAREALPFSVEAFEMAPESSEHLGKLRHILIEDLFRDRSPWSAELLFRVELAAVRELRSLGNAQESGASLQVPFGLISEYDRLKYSVCLPEVLVERGLQLCAEGRAAEAKRVFGEAIEFGKKFGDRGLGVVWCGHAALSHIPEEAAEVASKHAQSARACEKRIQELGELVDARDYLNRRYRIAEAFGK